ncbi:MAG: hypothetical protein IPN15_16335 [Saprospiraceae bacterium]|nr:hypothetical protein [Candidatus Vicinibacter affinis]
MKRLYILLTIISILSCEKNSIFDNDGFYGEGKAKLDEVEWKGNTGIFKAKKYCFPDTCVGIVIDGFNEARSVRSNIIINQVFLKTGKFYFNPIYPTFKDTLYRFSYHEFSGDAVVGVYNIIEADSNNYVEIKELNMKTGDVRGSFQARVISNSDWPSNGSLPDTIDITNGSFYGKINWK